MVSGGMGDDATFLFFGCQLGDGIVGASEFEGADALEIFTFEKYFAAGEAVCGE
jgi:hypothetical protein